ncbi:hypothetical protein TSUD_299110 [Trifolium subterraneum]|nr:hypothetical protein TSUD_299110 [Trifolium subterraneum]
MAGADSDAESCDDSEPDQDFDNDDDLDEVPSNYTNEQLMIYLRKSMLKFVDASSELNDFKTKNPTTSICLKKCYPRLYIVFLPKDIKGKAMIVSESEEDSEVRVQKSESVSEASTSAPKTTSEEPTKVLKTYESNVSKVKILKQSESVMKNKTKILVYSKPESWEFSKLMHDEFEMSMMGELKFFLGIQINQRNEGTFIHQTKYIKELLKKFNLEDCKPMSTPMHPTSSLTKDESEGKVDQKLYRDPRESHLTVVKRIFRYLKGTTNLGIFYKKSNDFKLVGFCDADYAGDKSERKSTSGNCQFIGANLISWANPAPQSDIHSSSYGLHNKKEFRMKAWVLDRKYATDQEQEMIIRNPELKGKSRAEMGLPPFNGPEIHSNIGGLKIKILRGHFAALLRLTSNGKRISMYDKEGIKSHRKAIVLIDELYVVFRILINSVIPRSGGTDTVSYPRRHLLYFLKTELEVMDAQSLKNMKLISHIAPKPQIAKDVVRAQLYCGNLPIISKANFLETSTSTKKKSKHPVKNLKIIDQLSEEICGQPSEKPTEESMPEADTQKQPYNIITDSETESDDNKTLVERFQRKRPASTPSNISSNPSLEKKPHAYRRLYKPIESPTQSLFPQFQPSKLSSSSQQPNIHQPENFQSIPSQQSPQNSPQIQTSPLHQQATPNHSPHSSPQKNPSLSPYPIVEQSPPSTPSDNQIDLPRLTYLRNEAVIHSNDFLHEFHKVQDYFHASMQTMAAQYVRQSDATITEKFSISAYIKRLLDYPHILNELSMEICEVVITAQKQQHVEEIEAARQAQLRMKLSNGLRKRFKEWLSKYKNNESYKLRMSSLGTLSHVSDLLIRMEDKMTAQEEKQLTMETKLDSLVETQAHILAMLAKLTTCSKPNQPNQP